MRRCHSCGQPLANKAMFCPRCGAKQPREPKGNRERRIRYAHPLYFFADGQG